MDGGGGRQWRGREVAGGRRRSAYRQSTESAQPSGPRWRSLVAPLELVESPRESVGAAQVGAQDDLAWAACFNMPRRPLPLLAHFRN